MSAPFDLAAIRKRNEERKLDPRQHYQFGCAGRTRGIHVHDDRCAPPATVDIDALLAEVERLRKALHREFFGDATPSETADVLGIEWPPHR